MRRSLSFLLLVSMLLLMPASVFAQEAAEGLDYRVENDGTATITGYSGGKSEVSIPSEIGGHPVKAIGNGAFYNVTEINSVFIPEGVTQIGDGAFDSCSNLISVDLPSTIVSIGARAFGGCEALKSIRIPEGVTEIKRDTFFFCFGLEEIILPASLKVIGDYAFSGCAAESIDLPLGLERIGTSGLGNNENLKSLVIPSSVKKLGYSAFSNCEKLETVVMSSGVKSLPYGTFNSCPSLEKVVIPKSVTSINRTSMFDRSYKVNIWGVKGSAAENYARKANIPFVALDLVQDVILLLNDENVTKGKITIDLATGNTTRQFSAQTSPENPWPGVIWKSSNAKVASVDASGLVTGLKKGKVTITATAVDGSGMKATCEINVANLVKEISISGENTVEAGKKTALKATVLPENADNRKLDWTTSDKSIATVDAKGVVTAKKVSEAKTVTITAAAKDGSGVIAEFIITVTP